MDQEDSFAEYVGARWSALYRLSVLLVGESRADDLTQTALLRAFASWDRVREAAAPDAYVKRILVNTAITEGKKTKRFSTVDVHRAEPGSASPEAGVLDRAELWPRISALPARQRAVIVLRYYEDLSEAEIADVLGCARGTVKAHASQALKALRVTYVPTLDPESTGGHHG